MRRIFVLAVAGIAALSIVSSRGEEIEAPPPVPDAAESKVIALVAVGDVDAATAERVRAFAQENTFVPVRLTTHPAIEGGSLDEIAKVLAAEMGEDVVFTVALAMPVSDVMSHGIYLPESRVSVVNVKPMLVEDGDVEKFSRRLERGVMQAIGMLLGMASCPNPHCVLWAYGSLEELDAKGRNFCPPCLERSQALAGEKGLEIVDMWNAEEVE